MSWGDHMVAWDTMFIVPFFSGLLVSALLSAVGVLLRLRNEWLAAFGYAHLAGAGALIGLAIHLPTVIGATIGAAAGAVIKALGSFRGNTVYGLIILAGWAITLLVAVNTTLGYQIHRAVVEGYLYFADLTNLSAAAAISVSAAAGLYRLMPIVIRNRFFPGYDAANHLPTWRWQVGFDLLTALCVAVGTATVGLMAAFALVLIPPWLAFRWASHWKQALAISTGFGTVGYILSFILALLTDQPFGPVLVALLLVVAGALLSLQRQD